MPNHLNKTWPPYPGHPLNQVAQWKKHSPLNMLHLAAAVPDPSIALHERDPPVALNVNARATVQLAQVIKERHLQMDDPDAVKLRPVLFGCSESPRAEISG